MSNPVSMQARTKNPKLFFVYSPSYSLSISITSLPIHLTCFPNQNGHFVPYPHHSPSPGEAISASVSSS
jgi:hypothetical protein